MRMFLFYVYLICSGEASSISERHNDDLRCAPLTFEQSQETPHLSKARNQWESWLRASSAADDLLSSKNPNLLRKARLDYVTRGIQYAWVKYAENAFGAAEIDPMTGRTRLSEKSAVPHMILDNIDTLYMIGWRSEVDRILRWLELGTIFSEIISTNDPTTQSYCSYCFYRRIYWSALMKTKAVEEDVINFSDLQTRIEKFLKEDEFDQKLEESIDRYFPPLDMVSNSKRNTTEDLLLLKNSFHGIYALQSSEISSFFETTIRGLGGLIGAWRLIGHPILSYSAWNLGHRLAHNLFLCDFVEGSLPCLPPRHISLDAWNRLAEDLDHDRCAFNSTSPAKFMTTAAVVMSNQLEFAALSDLLGICEYYEASLRTMRQFLGSSNNELLTRDMTVQKLAFTRMTVDVPDAESDSAYEYLVKLHYLDETISNELWPRIKRIFKILPTLVRSINSTDPLGEIVQDLPLDSVYRKPEFTWLHRTINRTTPEGDTMTSLKPVTSHLACFAGGLFILASNILEDTEKEQTRKAAFNLADTCFEAAALKPGCLAPEDLIDDNSPVKLRPEIIESLYYAMKSSDAPEAKRAYEDKIWKLTEAVLTQTRQMYGFCNYNALLSEALQCQQESWLLSETFKYAAMTFGLLTTSEFSIESLRNSSRAATHALRTRRAGMTSLKTKPSTCDDNDSVRRRNSLIQYLNLAPDDPWKRLRLNATKLSQATNSTLGTHIVVDLKLQSDIRLKKEITGPVLTTEAHILWPLDLTAASCAK